MSPALPLSTFSILAYAQQADLSGSDWQLVIFSLVAIAISATLGLAAVAVVKHRRPGLTRHALLAALLWAATASGVTIHALFARKSWSAEQSLLLKTGYYDPTTAPPIPAYPIGPWIILGLFWSIAMILVLALPRHSHQPPGQKAV